MENLRLSEARNWKILTSYNHRFVIRFGRRIPTYLCMYKYSQMEDTYMYKYSQIRFIAHSRDERELNQKCAINWMVQ